MKPNPNNQMHVNNILEVLRGYIDPVEHSSLVRFTGGYYEFYTDSRLVYDFKPATPGEALRWIEHIAGKSWVTKAHIEQFARLAANQFGARYL